MVAQGREELAEEDVAADAAVDVNLVLVCRGYIDFDISNWHRRELDRYRGRGHESPDVAAAGLILRSTDSGASWAEIATGTAKGLNAIGFLYENTDVGWVVGDSGTLLYTDDGGAHFRALQSPLAVDLYSVEDL